MGVSHRLCALIGALVLTVSGTAAAETLLIANKGEDTISLVDLSTGKERARVPTGHAPHEIAVSPGGRQAAVVAYGGTTIDILDIASAKILKRIDLAPNAAPHGIAWLRDGRIVTVADRTNTLVFVDPATGHRRSIATGGEGSHMLAVSADQQRAYVANIRSGTISVFDLETERKLSDFSVGGAPEGIALARGDKELWIGDDVASQVRVLDVKTGRIVAVLPSDPVAIRVATSPNGRKIVTSNFLSGTLGVYDVRKRRAIRTISVSGKRAALQVTLLFSRRRGTLFVAETGQNTVAEVDLGSGEVLRRIPSGRNGDGLAIAR